LQDTRDGARQPLLKPIELIVEMRVRVFGHAVSSARDPVWFQVSGLPHALPRLQTTSYYASAADHRKIKFRFGDHSETVLPHAHHPPAVVRNVHLLTFNADILVPYQAALLLGAAVKPSIRAE